MKILSVDIQKIYPNKNQPRKFFDDESILELSKSIRRHGLLQPIVVCQEKDGYRIIAGERRYRALQKLGVPTVSCIIREPEETEELALIENLQREDLNALDKARAIRDFMLRNDLTQLEAAKRLSKTRSYIANCVRLLNLDDYTKNLLDSGQLSEGHAKALLGIKEEKIRQEIARRVLSEGLSVRATEKLSQKTKKAGVDSSSPSNEEDRLLIEAEEQLTELLDTKVRLLKDSNGRSGKILIEFYSESQLTDLVNKLLEQE